ncbi:TcmI family type II polyketide cyclase [Micromonospora sp. DPT]|uniref:TcmI family type II polyketide cyclase n=1 Tax=Micromonospora sp. DPT TaxID=3142975 RepID=UPI00320A66A7
MVFRNVIVCHMVPGSDDIVGDVFGYYDKSTRPQDLGVIGRRLLSFHDLYIHVIERREDPRISGQTRGLPAFQKIAEAIAPYVTPYPKYWKNPSDSVAKEFYSWVPDEDSAPESAGRNLTVIIGRIKPGAEPDVARIFGESDAGSLPVQLGVTGRWLYSIDDVYVHLLERTDAAAADGAGQDHEQPVFAKIMAELSPYISPYNPEAWRGPEDSVAHEFYRWQAED